MDIKAKSLLKIHIGVLLFGGTGLFGRFVSVPAPLITFGRVVFSSISFFAFFKIKHIDIRLDSLKEYLLIIFTGAVLALHWSAFYQSVKVSTVAIALITFATYPIFVTFAEPAMFHEKLKKKDLLCSIIMFIGVIIIVPEFHLANTMTLGIAWGMLSSFTWSFISLINRIFALKYQGAVVAFYEQCTAAVVLAPLFFYLRPALCVKDVCLLALLGVVFTGLAHSLVISGMKVVRAQTTGIISSLETPYGIIYAALLLGEIPTFKELLGGAIILLTAFYSTVLSKKEN